MPRKEELKTGNRKRVWQGETKLESLGQKGTNSENRGRKDTASEGRTGREASPKGRSRKEPASEGRTGREASPEGRSRRDTSPKDKKQKKEANQNLCPAAAKCGGCQWINKSYEEQLRVKSMGFHKLCKHFLLKQNTLTHKDCPFPVEHSQYKMPMFALFRGKS